MPRKLFFSLTPEEIESNDKGFQIESVNQSHEHLWD